MNIDSLRCNAQLIDASDDLGRERLVDLKQIDILCRKVRIPADLANRLNRCRKKFRWTLAMMSAS